jgi:hypothetical protein
MLRSSWSSAISIPALARIVQGVFASRSRVVVTPFGPATTVILGSIMTTALCGAVERQFLRIASPIRHDCSKHALEM